MQASHCREVDTRWPYEYGILNFARRWPRTWSTANQQPKQVRCLQKVTRWHPNHTRRQHEDVHFYLSSLPAGHTNATRWLHDDVLAKRYQQYEENNMLRALHLVRNRRWAVRKAAIICGVPRSSLYDKVTGRSKVDIQQGAPTLFTKEEEKLLADHAKYFAKFPTHSAERSFYAWLQTLLSLRARNLTGVGPLNTITSERGALTTVLATGNTKVLKPGSKFHMSDSGWSNGNIFQTYLEEHFLQFIPNRNADQHALLLYDGHNCHISVPLIEIAKSHTVTYFYLFYLPIQAMCFNLLTRVFSAL
ncbi:uncharacterized protein [Apostichopus japonicus]|uniref:uncharacterized protein n=1 Tax=Stichopus japonicus TaxID=307972 RepID=UPI003AB20A32